MIYVSKNQLQQVEYLIQQSIQGNHVLFDPQVVKRILTDRTDPLSEEDCYEVEHHIERLISLPSLIEKRAYMEALDEQTYSRVVRTYFNIVENNLYEKKKVTH